MAGCILRKTVTAEPNAAAVAPASTERVRARRAPEEREMLRQSIVDAVRALHQGGGIEAVTMRGVAQAVGLPTMSLYRYYPTRNELMRCLWGEILARAFHASSRKATGASPQARLRGFLGGYIDYWFANEDDYWLVYCLRDRPGLEGTAGEAAIAFRKHFEVLARRCLPPTLDDRRLDEIHDLVRARVVGLLHICVALNFKGSLARPGYRDLVLDDIERSLSTWSV